MSQRSNWDREKKRKRSSGRRDRRSRSRSRGRSHRERKSYSRSRSRSRSSDRGGRRSDWRHESRDVDRSRGDSRGRRRGEQRRPPAQYKRPRQEPQSAPLEPSSTLVLKNLHPTSTEHSVKAFFSRFGTVQRVRLLRTPEGVLTGIGFVTFASIPEAASALSFHVQAGVVVDGKPLRIEYSKGGTKNRSQRSDWLCPQCGTHNFGRRDSCFKCQIPRPSHAVELHPVPSSVLMLKGVSASTSSYTIKTIFESFAPVVGVRLVPKPPGRTLCFVDFHSVPDATKALGKSRGISIEGVPISAFYAKGKEEHSKSHHVDPQIAQWQQAYQWTGGNTSSQSIADANNSLFLSNSSSSNTNTAAKATPSISYHSQTQQQQAIDPMAAFYEEVEKKETEVAVTPSTPPGFELDVSSGFYYNSSTAFYWDKVTGYYCEAKTGNYFLMDHSTGNLVPYTGNSSQQYHQQQQQSDGSKAIQQQQQQRKAKVIAKASGIDKSMANKMQLWSSRREELVVEAKPKAQQNSAVVIAPTAEILEAPVIKKQQKNSKKSKGKASRKNPDDPVIACLICKRKFADEKMLRKHEQLSQLHRQNLERIEKEKSKKGGKKNNKQKNQKGKKNKASSSAWPTPAAIIAASSGGGSGLGFDASVDNAAPIGSDNVGNKMLKAMGWSEGQGLGRNSDGRTDIIKGSRRAERAGLGSKEASHKDPFRNLPYHQASKAVAAARYAALLEKDD